MAERRTFIIPSTELADLVERELAEANSDYERSESSTHPGVWHLVIDDLDERLVVNALINSGWV